MSTNPIPNEAAAFKFANRPIMDAYPDAPIPAANLFKVQ